jgi:hypothetical protein
VPSAAFLVEAVKRFATNTAAAGTETQFIPHASTWLNGERWADTPPKPRPAAGSGRGGLVRAANGAVVERNW